MLVLLGVFAVGLCVTPATVLTVDEQSRIKDQLSQNIPGKDLETTYYNVASLKLLNSAVPKAEVKHSCNACFSLDLGPSIFSLRLISVLQLFRLRALC